MSIFNQLKQQLSEQLKNIKANADLMVFQATVALTAENVVLLSWLKAQKLYPHFFWQSRDTDQTIASLGITSSFHSLETAQQFIQQQQLTLLGGLQFDGECHFILPRLKLVKDAENLTAYFYLKADEFPQQAVIFEQVFANFGENQPLVLAENSLLDVKSACDFERWQTNIQKAIEYIEQQKFNKVVLANAKTLTFSQAICAYDLLAESQQTNLGCYHFIWAENAESAFVGSSPERLYQRVHQQFQTEALAGTAPVTESTIQTELNAEWLMTDPKNIYENQLVVDDIQQNLADCVEHIEVDNAEIKRLHNVQHLRRKIRATLKEGTTDANCLARIHPTAAVAGLPRQPAKQFIAENEPFKRQWYAGTLGYFSPQQAEFCVTLRSAQINQREMTLYAGAGIVQESEATSEWQEIERKSLALAKLLKI